MMDEHPILFSSEMVCAILDGRKTQTRRVIKPQPFLSNISTKGFSSVDERNRAELQWLIENKCPYGKSADLLWVREGWARMQDGTICYKADYPASIPMYATKQFGGTGWKPSIHMSKSICRIWLEIVNVRIQRLHEISPFDVEAEGTSESEGIFDGFEKLWNSINSERGYGWNKNPWVWVVGFRKVDK